MLYTCYYTDAHFEDQDSISIQVQRLGGWLAVRLYRTYYWIPEPYRWICHLYGDLHLVRCAKEDYIV